MFGLIPSSIAVLYKLFFIVPSLKVIVLTKFFSITFEIKELPFFSLSNIRFFFLSISTVKFIIFILFFLSILKKIFWFNFKIPRFLFLVTVSKNNFFSIFGILIFFIMLSNVSPCFTIYSIFINLGFSPEVIFFID